jgi:PAS domain S-box-containing protein
MKREALGRLFAPPEAGATAVLHSLQDSRSNSRWSTLILSKAAYLLMISVLLALILAPRNSISSRDQEMLSITLLSFLVYVLFLEFASRKWKTSYEKSWFRTTRIVANFIVVTAVVGLTSGQDSYFWFFYALPILQTIFYYERNSIAIITLSSIVAYCLVSFISISETASLLDPARLVMNSLSLILLAFVFSLLFHRANSAITKANARTQQLEVLYQLSQSINAAPSLQSALQTALEQGLSTIGVTEGSIMTWNPQMNALELQAWLVSGRFVPDKTHRKLSVGEGVAGNVIISRQPYIYSGDPNDPWFVPSPTNRTIRSLVCVPIIAHGQGQALGVISADSNHPDYFSQNDVHFLKALAEQLSIAIETHRLQELGLVLATFDLDALLARIVENAAMLTGAEFSTLFLTDDESSDLIRAQNYPPARSTVENPRPNGLSAMILRTGEPIVIDDAQNDSRVKQKSKDEGIQAIMGVPLITRITDPHGENTKTAGVLWVNTTQPRSWSKRDELLLKVLARLAAAAYENAKLFNRTEQSYQALRELHEVALQLTSYQPFTKLTESILKRAVRLLRAKGGGLYLLDDKRNEVRLAAVENIPTDFKQMRFKPGNSVVGQVISSKQSFAVGNYREWPNRLQVYDHFGYTAVAGAPIIWRENGHEEMLGVITIRDNEEGRVFSQEELDLLSHLGNLAAIGLENSRQHGQLEQLFAFAAHAILVVDGEGNVIQCNPEASRLLGYTEQELLNQVVTNLYHDSTEAYAIQGELSRSKNGRIADRDTHVQTSAGEKIPIRLTAALLPDYEGNHGGSVGFFRDLRDIESARRHSMQLKRLLESSHAITQLHDLDVVLEKIVDISQRILQAEPVSLYLYDDSKNLISAPPLRRGLYFREEVSEDVGPDSIVRKVLESGKVHFFEDAQAEDSLVKGDFVNREDIVSCAAGPLVAKDKCVGVFFCNYRKPHVFTQEEQTIFQLFANLAAIAIENARLFENIQQRTHALEILNRTALDIATIEEISELMEVILDAAVELLNGTGGALYLCDSQQVSAQLQEVRNLPEQLIGTSIPVGKNLVGKIIASREPQLVQEYAEWLHRLPMFDTLQLTSVAGAPIYWHDRVWGAIVVHSDAQGPHFQQTDLDTLKLLGNLASVTFQNVWRKEELQGVLSSSFDAIIAVDQTGRVTQFNKKAESILGYEAKEVLGKPLSLLYMEPDEASNVQKMLRDSDDGRLPFYETFVRSKNGDRIRIHLSASLLPNFMGEYAGSVGFFQDAREKEALRERIEELERDVDAQNTVNVALVLLSRWGHTAKNKIFALQGDLANLKQELHDIPECVEILKNMTASLRELSYPAHSLLQESEEILHQKTGMVDAGKLFYEMALQICNQAESDITLMPEIVTSKPLWVDGSRLLLETAFELLLVNAVESIKKKKEKPAVLSLKTAIEKEWVKLSLEDTGTGIPHDIRADLYRQPVASDTGFGYGSFIVATILRAHGGSIEGQRYGKTRNLY